MSSRHTASTSASRSISSAVTNRSSSIALALLEHDVPPRDQRFRLELRRRLRERDDEAVLPLTEGAEYGVVRVGFLAGEVHLRHQAAPATSDAEVNVRRADHRTRGVRARLDGLEAV